MSAIKFSLTSSQDKDLDDLTKTEKQVEDEGNNSIGNICFIKKILAK